MALICRKMPKGLVVAVGLAHGFLNLGPCPDVSTAFTLSWHGQSEEVFDIPCPLPFPPSHPIPRGLWFIPRPLPLSPFQNIDTLERVAGLEPEDLVEAHGTYYTSHCISPLCRQEYALSWMKGKGPEGTCQAGLPPTVRSSAPGVGSLASGHQFCPTQLCGSSQ